MGPVLLPWRGRWPQIAEDAWVAPGATVIGDVEIGSQASVWFGCVVRGDVHSIRIGARSNLQDGTVVHVTRDRFACSIGSDVLVGHSCVIHGCTLEDRAFVGMRATVLDGATVCSGAMVAAGALVGPGRVVPAGELWGGVPARFIREVRPEEPVEWADRVAHYVELAAEYASGER